MNKETRTVMQRILSLLNKQTEDEMAISKALVAAAGDDKKWPEKFETFSGGQWVADEIRQYMKPAKGEWAIWMLHAPARLQNSLGYCSVIEQNKFRYKVRFVTEVNGAEGKVQSVKLHDLKAHQLDQLIDYTTPTAHVRNDVEQKAWLNKPVPEGKAQPRNGHTRIDRFIRGSCTAEEAKVISHFVASRERKEQWTDVCWNMMLAHHSAATQAQVAA